MWLTHPSQLPALGWPFNPANLPSQLPMPPTPPVASQLPAGQPVHPSQLPAGQPPHIDHTLPEHPGTPTHPVQPVPPGASQLPVPPTPPIASQLPSGPGQPPHASQLPSGPGGPVDPNYGVDMPVHPDQGLPGQPPHASQLPVPPMPPKPTTLPHFNPSGSHVVAEIKARTDALITYIYENVPHNRERAIALSRYEEAAMWAVKANFT
jgi:hypothetical protein